MAVTCSTVAEQIYPYMDGELPEPACAEVERHLGGCPTCRESLAALQGMGRLLRRELADAAGSPPSLWPAIAERLGAPAGADGASTGRRGVVSRPERALRRLAWRTMVPALAAAAAVIAAVGLQLGGEPVTPPEQLAQVASVEGGDDASVVLLAGTPYEPPIILVTESPAPLRLPDGGSSL